MGVRGIGYLSGFMITFTEYKQNHCVGNVKCNCCIYQQVYSLHILLTLSLSSGMPNSVKNNGLSGREVP